MTQLSVVDVKIIEKTLRLKKRKERIAMALLKRYVIEVVLKKQYPDDLIYSIFGKPFVRDGSFEVNFSGNSDFVVAAIRQGKPVGVDVEKNKPMPAKALRAFFTEDECKYLSTHEDRFGYMWTRKEAFLKCLGTGFGNFGKNVKCNLLLDKVTYENQEYSFTEFELSDDVVGCVCQEGEKTEVKLREITIEEIC